MTRPLLGLLLALLAAPASAALKQADARTLLSKRDYPGALAAYNTLARGSSDAPVVAEYAYALAQLGFGEAALAQLDRAFVLAPRDASVLHFGARILDALGLRDAAREFERPAPAWLGTPGALALKPERDLGSFKGEFAAANLLMTQKRFPSAAVRFQRLTAKHPQEPLGWSGYAIALEKLGAYRSATAAVGKNIELSPKDSPEARERKTAHKRELESRPPVETAAAPRADEMLKGRYLSYFGGSATRTPDVTLVFINARLGKFLTDRLNAAVDAGLTSGYDDDDYNGLNFGASARYYTPLPVAMPLRATLGARVSINPAPSDKTTFLVSPGLSYFLEGGSLDLNLDFATSGPLKGTRTLSLGYTAFFGGSR